MYWVDNIVVYNKRIENININPWEQFIIAGTGQ